MNTASAAALRIGKWVASLWLAFVPLIVDAGQLLVLLDTDNNVATGCTVQVPGGTFAGVESVLTTNVDSTANPPLVTGVTQQNCVAPAANTLGPPIPVSPGGWNVGLGLGVAGFDVVETFFPTATPFGTYRLGFVYTDPVTGSDALVTANGASNGPPIVFVLGSPLVPVSTPTIPTLTNLGLLLLAAALSGCALVVLRRHRAPLIVVVAVVAVLMTTSVIAVNGFIHDWSGIPPVATDPVGDAPAGSDISAAFASAAAAEGRVYFRADVMIRSAQTVTFTSAAPVNATVGGPTYNVAATASSGLPVALTIDPVAAAVCTMAGSTVSFVAAGTCVIDANQSGNGNYSAAPQMQQTFGVGKGSQAITFTSVAPAGATPGGPTYNVTATASSGLAVTLTIDASASAVCTIAGSTVSFIGIGTCAIDANQSGSANFNAAPQVQQTFAVGNGQQTITFTSTAPVGATVGGATYNVTASASSGLPVTLTIDASASSVCSLAGSTVSFIGAGTCIIDANQAGNGTYAPAPQAQQPFSVVKGTQTITFTSTAPTAPSVGGPTYNVTATASSGLPVTLTIDATATGVCSLAGSTVSFIGTGTCRIDGNQAGNASYSAAPQAQQTFVVSITNQTITFTSPVPAAASVGGATYNVTATGGASGNPVTFTIDATAASVCSIIGSTVSFIGAGTCVIDANQAGSAGFGAAPQAQQSFAVGKGGQIITFTSPAPVTAAVGGATYNVTATGGASGNPVTFTIDATATSVCSIAGSTVSFIGAGTCAIDGNQAGNANYNAAPQTQQSFAVGKGSQTIAFTSPAPVTATVGGPTYGVMATGGASGNPVTFTIDASAASVCSIAGATVSFIGAGTCVIDANQTGNANYNAAPQAQQSVAVGQGNQAINFTSPAPVAATFGGPTYNVTATGGASGNPVIFTIDATATAVCSIAGSTVSFIGAGTCVIDANQAGNANYNSAPQAQQSFVVGKASQSISFTSSAPAAPVVAGPTYNVTATGGASGNPVTFTIDAAATSVCTIAGSTVSFIGAGTCSIDANQAGNTSYNAAPQAQQSFAVAKASQSISFNSSPSNPGVGGPTYNVTATATSGLPVTFTIDATASAVCTIAGSTVSFIGAGTCVIDANQPGNGSYNAAPQAQQSFAVKSQQTISFTSTAPANALVGGATYNVTATATSSLTVTFTIDAVASAVCTIAGSMVSFIGVGTCVIDANQAGNASFLPAPQVQQSFAVKNTQSISFTSTPPIAVVYQGPTYGVTATASSGLGVTFTIDATASTVCSIAGSTVSFIGTGTCVIDADQAGNGSFVPAPQVQQSFTVGPKLVGDSYSVVGNTQLVAANQSAPTTPFTASATSILANDAADVAITLTTVSSVATTAGGLITIAADGSFTYTPPVGQSSGTDSYVYTGTAHGVSRTATITFNIANIVWFVDNASAGAHDGRSNSPFLNMGSGAGNLGSALSNAGPASGAFISVAKGSGSTSGAYTFKSSQKLIGAGATLTVGALTITGSAANTPTLSGTLTLANSVTINGIDMSTGASSGIVGTGVTGLSVTVRDLTTTTGTAVSIGGAANTGGFLFHSISSNGAVNGISVANFSGGGFTVQGDGGGSSNGSGGTIQNSTGIGILLSSADDISLGYMNVQNGSAGGIKGTGVTTSFALNHSNVTGNGISTNDDGLQLGESSGSTVGVTGLVAITNSSISGNAHNNVHIRNTSGTISSFTVSGSSFNNLNDTFGANSFLFEGSGTSVLTSASFTGNTFQNNSPQRGLEVQAHDTATIGTFTVSGNTFIDNGIQASFTQDGAANLTFKFLNNGTVATPMTGSILQAVNVFSSATATGGAITGTIQGNQIGNAAVAGSGSTQGQGISVLIQGSTDSTLLVDNNVIRQVGLTSGSQGIILDFRGATTTGLGLASLNDVTLTNNNVQTNAPAATFPLGAIFIRADNQGSPAQVRADVRSNVVPTTGSFDYPSFDGNGAQLVYVNAVPATAVAQLVNNAPTAATGTAQLQSHNTGLMYADAPPGVTLIAGPINTPP